MYFEAVSTNIIWIISKVSFFVLEGQCGEITILNFPSFCGQFLC